MATAGLCQSVDIFVCTEAWVYLFAYNTNCQRFKCPEMGEYADVGHGGIKQVAFSVRLSRMIVRGLSTMLHCLVPEAMCQWARDVLSSRVFTVSRCLK